MSRRFSKLDGRNVAGNWEREGVENVQKSKAMQSKRFAGNCERKGLKNVQKPKSTRFLGEDERGAGSNLYRLNCSAGDRLYRSFSMDG